MTNETSNWYLESIQSQLQTATNTKNWDAQNKLSELWPFCLNYFSTLNPTFLSTVGSINQLNQKPIILVRDGLIPLTWFFSTVEPNTVRPVLLVHIDLAPFVPRAWRQKVNFWMLDNHDKAVSTQKSSIVLGLLVSNTAINNSNLKKLISDFEKLANTPYRRKLPIKCFAPIRRHAFGEQEETLAANVISNLTNRFGDRIEYIEGADVVSRNIHKNSYYAEINSGYYFKDSYLSHFALSNGATLLTSTNSPSISAENGIPLSNFHCVKIYSRIKLGENAFKLEKEVARQQMTIANSIGLNRELHAPWPDWFDKMVKNQNVK